MFWYVILAIVIAVIFQLLQISYISGKLKNLAINLDSGLNNRSMKSFYALPITIENQYQDYNYKMSYGFPSASAFNLGPTLMNNYIQFEFFKQTKTNIRFQAYNTNTRGIFYKQMVKVGNPKDRINIDDSRYILLSPENDDNSLDKNVFSGEIVDLIGKMLDYFDVIIYEDSKIVGRIYPCWANANSNIEYDRIKSILELVTKL